MFNQSLIVETSAQKMRAALLSHGKMEEIMGVSSILPVSSVPGVL
jgi:hypothetical protein